MAQRLRYFLVVLLLMFAKENFAQIFSGNDSLTSFRLYTPVYKKVNVASRCFGNQSSPFRLLSPIEKNLYVLQLGVFCKKEFELEKLTSVPLRLRLGSLDYTNYLEQKPNAVKPLY